MSGMRIFKIFSSIVFAGLLFTTSAWATVGQGTSSVQSDMAQLKGKNLKITTNSVYTTYSFYARGDTIKEYANSSGVIFAMTWRGVTQPLLRDVLGKYYNGYSSKFAARVQARIRHPFVVKTPSIKVMRGGHMRDWRGVAFVQSLAPSGVTAGDLQ